MPLSRNLRAPRRLHGVLALVPLLLAGVLVTAPSDAAGLSSSDPAGDAWRYVEGDTYVAVEDVDNIDLRRSRVEHRVSRVWAQGTFAALTKHPKQGTWLSVGTWDGVGEVYFQVLAYVGPESRRGVVTVRRLTVDGETTTVPCRGAEPAVDYRRDTLTVSFPRACVESPRLLHWQLESFSVRALGTERERTLTDDARSTEARAQVWEPGLRRG